MQQETSINAILVRISSPSTSTVLSPVGPMADAVCFFGGQKTRFHDIDSFEPSSVNLKVLGDSCLPNPNKLVAFCKGVLPKSPDASGHQKKNETVPVFETTCKTADSLGKNGSSGFHHHHKAGGLTSLERPPSSHYTDYTPGN